MVDLSFLENFTKGDIPKMKRYIAMYLNAAPDSFEKMRQNIEEKSWPELAINAHSLKPQAELIGISNLKEILFEIESNINENQFNDLEKLFKKAKSVHAESEVFLQEFINNK